MYAETESTPEVVIDPANLEELVHPFGATVVQERPQSTTIVIESPKPPISPVVMQKVATPPPQELKVATPQPQERKKSGDKTRWSAGEGSITDRRLTYFPLHSPKITNVSNLGAVQILHNHFGGGGGGWQG